MRTVGPIAVLIVDDSPLVRSVLTRVLSQAEDIEVVGGASNPYEARDLIIRYRPSVIILDIEMPRMDGLTFLRKLQEHYPVPVIMCSGAAPANSARAIEAIEIGAVDVVAKPDSGGTRALALLGDELAEKIRAAAVSRPARPFIPQSVAASPARFADAGLDPRRYVVAVGASTGGTEAIRRLLANVPPDFPPVVMVQHMPEGFTRSFAERLNEHSAMTVTEAVDGDTLVPGRALLARGGTQMAVISTGGQLRVRYGSQELVNRHCPSVDVLFDSVTRIQDRQTVGVLLTGMGADGAQGLLRMRRAGAITFAQDRASCVVYGMPKVATEIGAAEFSSPPTEIPKALLKRLRTMIPQASRSA